MEEKKESLTTFSQYLVSLKNEFIKQLGEADKFEEEKKNAIPHEKWEDVKKTLEKELESINIVVEKIRILTSLRYRYRIRKILNRKGNEQVTSAFLILLKTAKKLIKPIRKMRKIIGLQLMYLNQEEYSKFRDKYNDERKLYLAIKDLIIKKKPIALSMAEQMKNQAQTSEQKKLAEEMTSYTRVLESSRFTGMRIAVMFFILVTLPAIFGCKSSQQPPLQKSTESKKIIVPGDVPSYTQSITDKINQDMKKNWELRRQKEEAGAKQQVPKKEIKKATEKITSYRYVTRNEPKLNLTIYKVQSGDVLGRIAKKYGVKTEDLKKRNGLSKKGANNLKIGQKLIIPQQTEKQFKVVLGVGHGFGWDKGATFKLGGKKYYEKDLNIATSNRVASYLEKLRIKTYYFKESRYKLSKRPSQYNYGTTSLEIHYDIGSKPFHIIVRSGNKEEQKLAEFIVEAVKHQGINVGKTPIKQDVRGLLMPKKGTIIVEAGGFKVLGKEMFNSKRMEKVAGGIANGLAMYLQAQKTMLAQK